MSKREQRNISITPQGNERDFREILSNKVNSAIVGLWFLAAEHLRLGTWDLIKGYTGGSDFDIAPRIAMQIINESSLCQNRVRRKNYISHQGFELLNGLGFLASDEQVHSFLDKRTVNQAQIMQEALALIRLNKGHYTGDVIAIDPHRIVSSTQRIMPMKKKQPEKPAEKMLQTFFALNTQTGQPIGFGIGSPSVNTTKATLGLLNMVAKVNKEALVLADKEHFTEGLMRAIKHDTQFQCLVPAISNDRIKKIEKSLNYQKQWAGYAIAESAFNFDGHKEKYRLIVQREGETLSSFTYKSFITLSDRSALQLLSELYAERWSIEEFFNFEGDMGFDRASTFNLNIRYGKMSLALLAQAAAYQFRQKLHKPYKNWNALHLSDSIFNSLDGDIKVKNDTIIVTCYNVPKEYNLQEHYQNLPNKLISEGINPKIPWLFNFKLNFMFK